MNNPWTTLTSREVYSNKWIRVTEHDVLNPAGGKGIYGKVHFKNKAIGIIPVDENGNTWLVGQYRYTLNEYSWEIPEGGGDKAFSPLEAGKRELLEETGIEAKEWDLILEMDLSNSATDEQAYIFVARQLNFYSPKPDEDEQLTIKKIPFKHLFNEVIEGKHLDSLTVAGVLKLGFLLGYKKM